MRCLILFVSIILTSRAAAQTGNVSVVVTSSGKGIDAATVSLLNAADSLWLQSDITDEHGVVMFKGVLTGNYIVSASAVGFTTGLQPVVVADGTTVLCAIALKKQASALAEVAVTAKKPFIEMGLGKTVVNVEGSAVTGGNVLDLMRRLPGVQVDGEGAISMRGKAGVLVLINDRPTYLTGEDLGAYLKSITVGEASQVELITQPGAKYDASGNTGVINIKLKKNIKPGWNGNVSASYGQGTYFRREENFMLSYRKNKLQVSLTGNDMEAIGFGNWKQEMYYTDVRGKITGSNINHANPKERFSHTSTGLFADYNLTDKTTIGVNMRGAYHPNKMTSHLEATYHDNSTGETINNNTVVKEGHIRKEVIANGYLSHKFSKDHMLDVNLDYLTFTKNADQEFTTTLYDEQMSLLQPPATGNSLQKSPITIYSIKADHTYAFKNGSKVESGIKYSRVTMDFDAAFHLLQNNSWVNDTGRSNHFLYEENIGAMYVTASKAFGKKWETKAGLRAEQTLAKGLQYRHNNSFTKRYLSLFPTAYITYKADSSNQFELNYGRRIDRPEYKQLNPFTYYSFQNMYSVGNPDLMPQYTNNMELKHSYKNMFITTLSYSATSDVIQGFLTVDDSSKISYNKLRNIASNRNLGLAVNFNRDVFKWWSLNVYLGGFYAEYEGLFNNAMKKTDWIGYYVYINSNFSLGHGWKAEFSGNYNSGGRWSLTSSYLSNTWIESGVSKKFNDHWSARFYTYDPFRLFNLRAKDYGINYTAQTSFRHASQMFTLALTYNFGSSQSSKNEHTIDEAKRL